MPLQDCIPAHLHVNMARRLPMTAAGVGMMCHRKCKRLCHQRGCHRQSIAALSRGERGQRL
eukprot:13318191-Alexandrium_andersonii.AAC.1